MNQDAALAVVDSGTLRAARRFVDEARVRYSIRDAYLFGSRARGTHRPDSDVDIAVILEGAVGNRGTAIIDLAGLAYDVMMETDFVIEATPLWAIEFDQPQGLSTFYIVKSIRRDGVRL